MKEIVLTIALIVIGLSSISGQNIEARLISSAGISSSNFNPGSEWTQNESHLNMFSAGVDINYFLGRKNKLGFYLGSGVSYKRNNYLYILQSNMFNYNINDIKFKQLHIGIPLRIGAEWNLFGSSSLGFEYDVQYNQATQSDFINESLNYLYAINKSLEYKYYLKNHNKSFFSQQISLFLKTQIGKNLYLFSSLGYEIRPTSGDFDFTTFQIQTLTEVETGLTQTRTSSHHINKNKIEDNLINFKLGVTKIF